MFLLFFKIRIFIFLNFYFYLFFFFYYNMCFLVFLQALSIFLVDFYDLPKFNFLWLTRTFDLIDRIQKFFINNFENCRINYNHYEAMNDKDTRWISHHFLFKLWKAFQCCPCIYYLELLDERTCFVLKSKAVIFLPLSDYH